MSYKVYTYKNPYELHNTDFWNEICSLPHFCSSSVMAQALWGMYGGKHNFSAFFWTIENLVHVAFPHWHNNVECQIAQHIAVGEMIQYWKIKDQRRGNRVELFSAMEHNKASLVDALRLFAELDIDCQSLHPDMNGVSPEQKAFIALYQMICSHEGSIAEAFDISTESFTSLNQLLNTLIDGSIDDERDHLTHNDPEADQLRLIRIKKLEEIKTRLSDKGCDRIVVHGIHQFTPLQLRLISALSDMGVEVIFLYNFLPEYREIYATWDQLYRLLDVPIHHDSIQETMLASGLQSNTSNALARTLATLFESDARTSSVERQRWLSDAANVELIEFQNTTEMANYVSKYVDKAIAHHSSNVARDIEEKVYTAAKESDNLLRVYYPQLIKNRHFLHYPIGQFFLGLYHMWNEDKLSLDIDIAYVRECIVADILGEFRGTNLSVVADILEPLFMDVTAYADVKKRLEGYVQAYARVQSEPQKCNPLRRHMDMYNPDVLSADEAKDFCKFIDQLEAIAETLFTESGHQIHRFMDHFRRLNQWIEAQSEQLVDQEEKQIVNDLLARFAEVPMKTELSGTMDDLRNGLFYYLKQKNEEQDNWFIRNFAQIEGDILRSRQQSDNDAITYHFSGLSDRMMTKKANDLLPWPLTDFFVHSAYSPNALVFQMYYTALCDYQAFVRYALFYGLYFNRCKVRISYIKHLADQEETLYYPLRLLQMNIHRLDPQTMVPETANRDASHGTIKMYRPTDNQRADFLLCPDKYYLDYVCQNGISYRSNYSIENFYVNLLICGLWEKLAEDKVTDRFEAKVDRVLAELQRDYDPFFPYLRHINDKADLRNTAKTYFSTNLIDTIKHKVKAYAPKQMELRFRYQKAVFTDEEIALHPYPSFEACITKEDSNRVVRLWKAVNGDSKKMAQDMRNYLEQSTPLSGHTGPWCSFCVHRNICLEPYRQDKKLWDEV